MFLEYCIVFSLSGGGITSRSPLAVMQEQRIHFTSGQPIDPTFVEIVGQSKGVRRWLYVLWPRPV